jgi:hypothetical protein
MGFRENERKEVANLGNSFEFCWKGEGRNGKVKGACIFRFALKDILFLVCFLGGWFIVLVLEFLRWEK